MSGRGVSEGDQHHVERTGADPATRGDLGVERAGPRQGQQHGGRGESWAGSRCLHLDPGVAFRRRDRVSVAVLPLEVGHSRRVGPTGSFLNSVRMSANVCRSPSYGNSPRGSREIGPITRPVALRAACHLCPHGATPICCTTSPNSRAPSHGSCGDSRPELLLDFREGRWSAPTPRATASSHRRPAASRSTGPGPPERGNSTR